MQMQPRRVSICTGCETSSQVTNTVVYETYTYM